MFSDVLLTVDYDRTLTDTNAVVPQRNLEAIRYFIENGGTFTINSGRSVPLTRCFRDIVPVNAPLLLFNGSAWYDLAGETLESSSPIDLDPVTTVYELQAKFPDLTVEIQGLDNHYIFKKNSVWEEYIDYHGCSWAYTTPDQTGPFLKFAVYSKFASPYPGDMYVVDPQENARILEAEAYIRSRWGDKVDAFRPCPRILDVQCKGVSKLRSARRLQEKLGKKLLVCVGDAENDLPMLEGADYAYCPADGVVADRFENVCPCDEGAVADVIYKKIPELLQNRA